MQVSGQVVMVTAIESSSSFQIDLSEIKALPDMMFGRAIFIGMAVCSFGELNPEWYILDLYAENPCYKMQIPEYADMR